MLFLRRFNSHEELRNILNGTPVSEGSAGTNTGGRRPSVLLFFQDLGESHFA